MKCLTFAAILIAGVSAKYTNVSELPFAMILQAEEEEVIPVVEPEKPVIGAEEEQDLVPIMEPEKPVVGSDVNDADKTAAELLEEY